jgi:putative membrane protein
MAVAETVRERARARPRMVTAVLSVVGYALVAAGFAGALPVPDLTKAQVDLFGHLIAVVNSAALASLLAGWWFIRQRRVGRHRAAMLTAFGLILVFLVLYLWKVSGGYTKEFYVPAGAPLAAYAGVIEAAYLSMLAVHVLLSAVSVPVVLHAVVLGLTHSPAELADTLHPRVGRVAAWAWSVSLALGVLAYVLLQVYDSRPLNEAALLLAVAWPRAAARRTDTPSDKTLYVEG